MTAKKMLVLGAVILGCGLLLSLFVGYSGWDNEGTYGAVVLVGAGVAAIVTWVWAGLTVLMSDDDNA